MRTYWDMIYPSHQPGLSHCKRSNEWHHILSSSKTKVPLSSVKHERVEREKMGCHDRSWKLWFNNLESTDTVTCRVRHALRTCCDPRDLPATTHTQVRVLHGFCKGRNSLPLSITIPARHIWSSEKALGTVTVWKRRPYCFNLQEKWDRKTLQTTPHHPDSPASVCIGCWPQLIPYSQIFFDQG